VLSNLEALDVAPVWHRLTELAGKLIAKERDAQEACRRHRRLVAQQRQDALDTVQLIHEAAVIGLTRAALGLRSVPDRPHLAFYHEYFGWTDPLTEEALAALGDLQIACSEVRANGRRSGDLLDCYLPPEWRKRLGQHWTPSTVVDYVLELTMDDQIGRTLDPAVGGGAFALGWLRRLRGSGASGSAEFVGYDVSPSALAVAGLNVERFHQVNPMRAAARVRLECRDTLRCFADHSEQLGLPWGDEQDAAFDYVVGNPPYVRVQHIRPPELRDYYRRSYPETATGRFDLCSLFIEAGYRALVDGGALGYIVSNKLLTSSAGAGVRELLARRLPLRYLTDLGDTKVFGAAVLPMVIVCRKRPDSASPFWYTFVSEAPEDVPSDAPADPAAAPLMSVLLEFRRQRTERRAVVPAHTGRRSGAFRVECRETTLPTNAVAPWHFTDRRDTDVLDTMKRNSVPLRDICVVLSAGIKSTADDVFCNPVTEEFLSQHGIEREYAKPYIRGANIRRWRVTWTGTVAGEDTYLLYPHRETDGQVRAVPLEEIPNMAAWFHQPENYRRLASRSYVLEASRRWYEVWVPQKPRYFTYPYKIVTPDFCPRNTFALDVNGWWCGGSAYMIVPSEQSEAWALYLLGLMNSTAMEYYHKAAASTFIYAKRYRYTVAALGTYPIPVPAPGIVDAVGTLASRLVASPGDDRLQRELDEATREAYGLRRTQWQTVQEAARAW